MAQYVEKVYAADSWQENRSKGESAGVARGAMIRSYVKHSFTYDGYTRGVTSTSGSFLGMEFPLSAVYGKKRLVSAKISAFVSDVSTDSSGSLKSGRMVFVIDDFGTDRFYVDEPDGFLLEAKDLTEGAYNVLIHYEDNLGGELSKAARAGKMTAAPNVWAGSTGGLYVGNVYSATAAVQVQSHTGENRPYAEYVYEDVIPSVKNCMPRSGFVDDGADNRFGWSFSYNDAAVQEELHQAAYSFRWRKSGEEVWNEQTVESAVCGHTVPAGTFPSGESVQWCVRSQSDDGIWSEWSPVYELTTVDALSVPQQLHPDKVYVNGNGEVDFGWIHVIETGTAQSAFEAQCSVDGGGSWQELCCGETAENGFSLAEGTLSSGEMLWRVRTANSDGVFGSWSEPASVIVRAKPAAPVINRVEAAPMVQVFWQAAEQQGYEVVVGTESSGQRYGTEKSWQAANCLPDKEHPVKVRVCNRYGLWSDWAEGAVTVKNLPQEKILLQSRAVGCEVQLSWQTKGEFVRYQVLRDGIRIGETQETKYTDRESCGKCRYRIIGLQKDGHYSQSDEITEVLRVKNAVIGRGGIWLPAGLGLDGAPQHQMKRQAPLAYSRYGGEGLPYAWLGDTEQIEHQLWFVPEKAAHLAQIKSWLGKRIIWKSPSGSCFAGVLDRVEYSETEAAQLQLTVVEAKEWSDE